MGSSFVGASREIPWPQREGGVDLFCDWAFARLTAVYERAPRLDMDGSSRFVFFSDLHRGDRSRADNFARNSTLFLRILEHYYTHDFTYFEVGDGDELWKNDDIAVIERAHPAVFALLRQFQREDRLRLILGNHDIVSSRHAATAKAGIPMIESIALRHVLTGRELLIAHGHQADVCSDALYRLAQWSVRHVWRPLQLLGAEERRGQAVPESEAGLAHGYDRSSANQLRIERRLLEWVAATGHAILCGHTHHPIFPRAGALPYFNTGTGVVPGSITGLEIQHDRIVLVRWLDRPGSPPLRQVLAAPLQLTTTL